MMVRGWAALALVFLGLLLGGCFPREDRGCPVCPGSGGAVIGVPFETVDQGEHSGIREERGVVVRDPKAWAALWQEHTAGRISPPPPPPVDFTRNMVVGYFLGEKSTAGYAVTVREIALHQDPVVVRVQVEVRSPPPGDPVAQVLTQPFHLVQVQRFDLPVEFHLVHVRADERTARP
jgi:hypothetical protein